MLFYCLSSPVQSSILNVSEEVPRIGGEDLAKYWFDVRPGGQRDNGHEGTADCGPRGVLRVHRQLVQGVGAEEARVHLTEEAGYGPVPLLMGTFWRRRVLVLVASMMIAGGEKAQTKKVDLRRSLSTSSS